LNAQLNQDDKEVEKRRKAEEKERQKRPVEITINADVEKVRSGLLRAMMNAEYRLDRESPLQMAFQKEVYGGQAMLMNEGGGQPRKEVSCVITKMGKGITIIADIRGVSPRKVGEPMRYDFNRDKKERGKIEKILQNAKSLAEQ
jgi:hypothetical protein